MEEAVRAAAEDAGAPALLGRLDRIAVPRGFWSYSDPGRLLAERLGSAGAETILAEFGVLQTTLLADACRAIRDGEADVALVVGGEAKYRSLRAEIAGVELEETQQRAVAPTHLWRPHDALWAEIEWERGLRFPVGYYALLESALRAKEGLGIGEHAERLGRLYEGFSRVAQNNPEAWRRAPFTAETIATPGTANPMLAFPYAKLHTSGWNVDQAAALLFCSAERAQALGIAPDRAIHPLAASESNHMAAVCERDVLFESEAARIAAERVCEAPGVAPADFTHVDLYSCFPVAVRFLARALGRSEGPFTVTGGMPFAGGPVNNYVLQATARMAGLLRESADATGLVTAVSGMFTKQGFLALSTEAPSAPFAFDDVSEEVAAATRVRRLDGRFEGAARVGGYTVLHEAGDPKRAIVVCDLENGDRTVAASEDPSLLAACMAEEWCGRTVRVSADGTFRAS